MPDRIVRLRIPDEFDALLTEHAGAENVTDDLRTVFIVAILASVVDGMDAPRIADQLVRLNGGYRLVPV